MDDEARMVLRQPVVLFVGTVLMPHRSLAMACAPF
jgi:hypothetical protein